MNVGSQANAGIGFVPPSEADRGTRVRSALIGSAIAHVLIFAVWSVTYTPNTAPPKPTARRVVKAVAVGPKDKPVEPQLPKPQKPPEPEPDAEPELVEPPPDVEPEPVGPSGPPPPPAMCENCALMPHTMGVPTKAKKGKGKAIPWGVPGGEPGGVIGGVPGGVVGGVVGGTLGADPALLGQGPGGPLTGPPPKPAPAPKPLKVVMKQAVYTPPPDPKLLAKTKTGMFSRHDGVNKTAFCVNEAGKTVSVRTVKRFEGDAQIDAICLAAVKQWRFKPAKMGGKKTRVCSVAVFDIKFE